MGRRWDSLDVTDGRHDHRHAADHHAHRDDDCEGEEGVEQGGGGGAEEGGGGGDTAENEPERDPEERRCPSASHSPMMTWSFLGVRTDRGPERPPTSAVAPGWLLLLVVVAAVLLSPPERLSEASVLLPRASVTWRELKTRGSGSKVVIGGKGGDGGGGHSNADMK